MTGTVLVDLAGARMGSAARWAEELRSYLARAGRLYVRMVGADHAVEPAWLVRREGRS